MLGTDVLAGPRAKRGHVMISHYLTPRGKQLFYKLLKVQSHIDRTVCYSTAQEKLARNELGLKPNQLALVLHPADGLFWRPAASLEEQEADDALLKQVWPDMLADKPLVCSAGLEFRDYPTLMKAAPAFAERCACGYRGIKPMVEAQEHN